MRMRKHRLNQWVIIFCVVSNVVTIHSMVAIKPRPQVVLSENKKKEIFEKYKNPEKVMQDAGYCKQSECKPGEYFIHQNGSKWGVCASQDIANLSGTLKNMFGDTGLQGGGVPLPMPPSTNITSDVIKDTFEYMKFLQEVDASKIPGVHKTGNIMQYFSRKSKGERGAFLRILTNVANGINFFDFENSMKDVIEKDIKFIVNSKPEGIEAQKCFNFLNPDVREKIFMKDIPSYLMDLIMKQKKITIEKDYYTQAMICSPDGSKLFVVDTNLDKSESWLNRLILWDLSNPNNADQILLAQDIFPYQVKSMRCSSDGQIVLITFGGSSKLMVVDLRNRKDIKHFYLNKEHEIGVILLQVRFAPDGRSIIAVYSNGLIARWNIQDKNKIDIVRLNIEPVAMAMSGDGQTMCFYPSNQDDAVGELVTINDQNQVTGNPCNVRFEKLSFDGKQAIKYKYNDTVFKLYDTSSMKSIDVKLPEGYQILSAAFMPNSSHIVCNMQKVSQIISKMQFWNIDQKDWVKDSFNIHFSKKIQFVSNTNIVCLQEKHFLDGVRGTAIIIENFLTDAERNAAEQLILQGSDQDLLLYQLYNRSKNDKFAPLSEDQTKMLETFSFDDQKLIRTLLLKKVEPKTYNDKTNIVRYEPAQQKGYLPEWLKSLWNAAYARVFGK